MAVSRVAPHPPVSRLFADPRGRWCRVCRPRLPARQMWFIVIDTAEGRFYDAPPYGGAIPLTDAQELCVRGESMLVLVSGGRGEDA
jgi:hypothetical protein